MKGLKSFNTKAAIQTAISVGVGGAGSAALDWVLKKYDVLPAEWGNTAVQAGKVIVGAVAGSMVKNSYVKSAFDGIATVAAANLVADMLPEETATAAGLPNGMIGRVRMGQRGFRRAAVRGTNGTPSAFMSK